MSEYRFLYHYPHHPFLQQPTAGPSTVPAQIHVDPPSASHPEDLKYIAKYKELKRKVKETELNNDRLHLKVLKTRKNIQRLQLERAILYERLSIIQTADTVPFPADPGLSHSTQPPPQPHHAPTHAGTIPTTEADRAHTPREAHRPAQAHHPQAPGTQAPPSHAPSRYHARYPGGSQRVGMARPHEAAPEPEPAAKPPGPVPDSTHGAATARIFPFVLEYAHSSVTAPPAAAYPTEVRFHPYEMSSHPGQRNPRNLGPELKFRHHRPEGQSQPQMCSPRSARGGYAYPPQHPFISEETRDAGDDHTLERPEEYQCEPHDDGRYRPLPRRESYSHSEQDLDMYEHTRDMRDERIHAQRIHTGAVGGGEHGMRSRMQEGDALD